MAVSAQAATNSLLTHTESLARQGGYTLGGMDWSAVSAHMSQPISESLLAMVGIAAASSARRMSLIQDLRLSACHKETLQLDTTVMQNTI